MSKFLFPAAIRAVVIAAAISQCMGCGGDKFPVAAAQGKVVCEGKPVTIGSVVFSPVGDSLETGKPATAAIGSDGTFKLTTNNRFDGAVIGKHRVQYMGPEGEDEEGSEAAPAEGSAEERAKNAELIRERRAQKKMQCVQKGEMIVEVTADGPNEFTIELVPAGT